MLPSFPYHQKSELPTPALLLDLDAVERNIEKMAGFFADKACKLRPHAKTHKLPWIAHRQVQAGAIGITCSKLEDAKAFAEAGIRDILISNEVVEHSKILELVNLFHLAHLTVCVDRLDNAEDLSAAALEAGVRLDVLMEVDVGIHRCGVAPGMPALELAQKLSKLPALSFRGLMGYEGGLFMMEEPEKVKTCRERNDRLIETRTLLEKSGFQVPVVSAGGSNTYRITGLRAGITDIQPGSYATMDEWNARHQIDFEQAITVLATVISRPEKERAIIDVGLKALSTDHGIPGILSPLGLEIEALNEEHGKVILKDPVSNISVGDKIEIIPSHGCTTIPLYSHYIGVKGDRTVATLRILSGGATY